MTKKTFIPNWYEDRKNRMLSRKVKICINLALIMNIILMSLIINISKEIKNIQRDRCGENNNSIVAKTVKKDVLIIEKYKGLSDFFEKNNFSYKNIILTKDNMEIDIEVVNYEEYISVIRGIEEYYSIKKLTPNINNEGNFNFKVIL